MKGKYNTLSVKIKYHASLETVYLFVILEIRAVVLWWLFWWCCGFLINVIWKRLQSITKKTHLWESNKQSYFKLNFHPSVKLRWLKSLKNVSFIQSLTMDFDISICVTYTRYVILYSKVVFIFSLTASVCKYTLDVIDINQG